MRARVGAMPQPKGSQHDQQPTGRGGGSSRAARVQNGMSLEDLKRETANRLAQEGDQPDVEGDESSEGIAAPVGGPISAVVEQQLNTAMHYQHYPPQAMHPYPREPPSVHYNHGGGGSFSPPNNQFPQHRGGGPPRGGGEYNGGPSPYGGYPADVPNNYSNESRNYTDSQLGLAGAGGGNNVPPPNNMPPPQFASPPPPAPYRGPLSQQPMQQQQQQYSTPRMPRHATVLKDRGSTENSVGSSSDPSMGGSESMGYGYASRNSRVGNHHHHSKASHTSPNLKVNHRVGSHGKNLNKAGGSRAPASMPAKAQVKEMRSPDGRHTPVRDRNLEGQVLFATPRREQVVPSTPSSVYSEPVRSSKHSNNNRPSHPSMSPNYNRMRSPDHHHSSGGNYSRGGNGGGGGGGGYQNQNQNKNQLNKHQNQSKLPHGLTVQELKEMTRARLAAEQAEIGPEGQGGSSDQSVHSAGTQTSSKGSDQISSCRGTNDSVTRNLVQSNDSIRRDYSNQGLSSGSGLSSQSFQGQHQQPLQPMQPQHHQPTNQPPQYNYLDPRRSSPIFGGPHCGGHGGPNQYNGNQPVVPRQLSPAFGLSSSQTRSQGDTWETASVASSEYQVAMAEPAYHNGGGVPYGFSSPNPDSRSMTFNRGRCFSAGATTGISGSFEQQHMQPLAQYGNYYDNVPMSGSANRQRCATVSPPGMSRLHEDRPFLFSTGDKERLAIPPLSEPRLRFHSTGGLNIHGSKAMRGAAFHSRMSSPPHPPTTNNNNVGSGSAFVPIGKNDQFLSHPQSPPPLTVDRSKFGVGDRTISTSSAASASGHGDLPSSMAEAVLESITSTTAPPFGGQILGIASPFRSTEADKVGKSPYRVSDSSENTSSAFRLDGLLPESSGNVSLFSSGESRNIFSLENSGERMLLGTHSWGGIEDETSQSHMGLSHDFSNVLNLSGGNNIGPPLRGRAATEPVWFGGHDPLLVSRIDPEHNAEAKPPPRVSSLDDTYNALSNFNAHSQQQDRKPGGL